MLIPNQLNVQQLATPSGTPAAGTFWIYTKSNGLTYIMNSAGVESVLNNNAPSNLALFNYFNYR